MTLCRLIALLLSSTLALAGPAAETSAGVAPPVFRDKVVAVVGDQADPIASTARELGFDCHALSWGELLSVPPRDLIAYFGAIICEDSTVPDSRAATTLKNYVVKQGGVLLLYKGEGGQPDAARELLALCGLKAEQPDGTDGTDSTETGQKAAPWSVPAASPLRGYFDSGVFSADEIRIFGCPALLDPLRSVVPEHCTILAWGAEIPRVARVVYPSGGSAIYVNSSLKRNWRAGNHVLVKPVMRYALSECAKLPRLVPSPDGISGLILNMHVCSSAYLPDLRRLLYQKAFTPDLPMSIHVTAGPDLNRPGDGLGVDATNPFRGKGIVLALSHFGEIGAHGGWAHNYWAYQFRKLSPSTKREYLVDNIESLTRVSRKPVREYSAPGGVHDYDLDETLASHGVSVTVYPFAMHSPPTARRPDMWHFGYTGTQYGLCFENMIASGRSDDDIWRNIDDLLESVVRLHEIRLIYFHPKSLVDRPQLWRKVCERLRELIGHRLLSVAPASSFVEWLNRFKGAKLTCFSGRYGMYVQVSSERSLKSVAVEVPDPGFELMIPFPVPEGVSMYRRDGCVVIHIDDDRSALCVVLPRRARISHP